MPTDGVQQSPNGSTLSYLRALRHFLLQPEEHTYGTAHPHA